MLKLHIAQAVSNLVAQVEAVVNISTCDMNMPVGDGDEGSFVAAEECTAEASSMQAGSRRYRHLQHEGH